MTQNKIRTQHNTTKGTAGERGKHQQQGRGRKQMEMDKQRMQVTMRGKGECKGWTIWMHAGVLHIVLPVCVVEA